jgi:hypothetical protein
VFTATRAAGKITGMKESLGSLTGEAGDEVPHKKLQKCFTVR